MWSSGLARSRDGGRTWGEYVAIAYDPQAVPTYCGSADESHCAGFNETTLQELPDGRVLAVLRQQGVAEGRRELYRSISTDRGKTWAEPARLPLWGTSPSLHLVTSGEVLLGYRNHLGNPQSLTAPGVGLSTSHDGGETWTGHLLLEDPKGYSYGHEFEAGYPAFLNLDGGQVMIVFYSFDPSWPSKRYLAANILSQ